MNRLGGIFKQLFLLTVLALLSFSALGQDYASVAFGETTWLVVWGGSHADSSNGVYGTRISQSGDVLDTPAIVLSVADYQVHPAVAFDGTNWLVVWDKDKYHGDDIYAVRVSQLGEVLDPEGIPISTAESYRGNPSIAFGTTSYLVVWGDWRNGYDNRDIYASRITPSGEVLDPEGIPISTVIGHQVSPSVAFDGATWLIVWRDCRNNPGYYEGDIYATRVTQLGEVLDSDGFPISPVIDYQSDPNLAFGEENYLVVWGDGARVTPAGVVLDPGGLDLGLGSPSVAFGETDWLAVRFEAQGSCQHPLVKGVLVDPSGSAQLLPDRLGVGYSPASVAFGETSWLVTWSMRAYGWPSNILGARVSQSGEILGLSSTISTFLGCTVELRQEGTSSPIDEIEVGEFFDIYVQASTVDTTITEVHFSSDDYLNGNCDGSWTDWFDWNTSSEDWNHVTKTKAWAFTTSGGKEVWAQVKDDAGDTSLCYACIFVGAVNQPPIANAGPDQTVTDTDGNGQENVTLDGSQSEDPDGDIISWVWTENGSQTATGETPAVTLSVGTHAVTLTVTDDDTATDTDQVIVTIVADSEPPVCALELRAVDSSNEISQIDMGQVFDIYVGASTDDGCITKVRFSSDNCQDAIADGDWTEWYDWNTSSDYWDASTKTKAWAFATSGPKEVWAEVKDGVGNTSRCHSNILATEPSVPSYPTPIALVRHYPSAWAGTIFHYLAIFSPPYYNTHQDITFDATWSTGGENISFEWNFGDGGPPASGAVVTHSYDDVGVYTVTLALENEFGIENTITTDFRANFRLMVLADW